MNEKIDHGATPSNQGGVISIQEAAGMLSDASVGAKSSDQVRDISALSIQMVSRVVRERMDLSFPLIRSYQ